MKITAFLFRNLATQLVILVLNTAWKVSVFGVILVHVFPHVHSIRRDTESESGKIRTRKTPNTDTFYIMKRLKSVSICHLWHPRNKYFIHSRNPSENILQNFGLSVTNLSQTKKGIVSYKIKCMYHCSLEQQFSKIILQPLFRNT